MNKRNPDLKAHFEKLKELVPEIYSRKNDLYSEKERLYSLLKKSLGVIEAVYLQNQETFGKESIAEYGKIIYELELMQYDYEGNDDLLSSAAAQILMQSKKPMKKAGKSSEQSDEGREAI
ncbi:MAG: hypothetical protein ACFHWX_08685 [Bacteroidota bacterium]